MNVFANLCAFLLIAALSGCAQNSGLSQLSILSAGGTAESADDRGSVSDEPQNGQDTAAASPPLPIRNAYRGGDREATASLAGSAGIGLVLPGLPDVKLFTATAYAPDATLWDDPPVAVYTTIAQQIHACWFTPGASKLPGHAFHAEVAPGNTTSAKIIIYKKDLEGKRGLQAFRISIDDAVSGSTVATENRRLEKPLETSFKTDLARWSKGNLKCQG